HLARTTGPERVELTEHATGHERHGRADLRTADSAADAAADGTGALTDRLGQHGVEQLREGTEVRVDPASTVHDQHRGGRRCSAEPGELAHGALGPRGTGTHLFHHAHSLAASHLRPASTEPDTGRSREPPVNHDPTVRSRAQWS